MAATTKYCTRQNVTDRLSSAGLNFFADDGINDALSDAEHVAATDEAILYAGSLIDAALTPHINTVPISQDDGSLNAWLRFRAIDLAVEFLATRRGGTASGGVKERAERAMEELKIVWLGKLRVPGLTYAVDSGDTERRRQFGRSMARSP